MQNIICKEISVGVGEHTNSKWGISIVTRFMINSQIIWIQAVGGLISELYYYSRIKWLVRE
jgi:hypothetical protein